MSRPAARRTIHRNRRRAGSAFALDRAPAVTSPAIRGAPAPAHISTVQRMPKPLTTERANARAGDLVASAVRTLELAASGISTLSHAIHDGLGRAFIDAVELVSRARGRVIVTGMGKSGHVGRKIAATLASTGTPAFFVHPSEASHGDLGMITPDDVIMALSWSGETVELKDLIDYSRRFRIGLIAITAVSESTLGR